MKHPQAQHGFRGESDAASDAGFLTASSVVAPAAGQIQLPVDGKASQTNEYDAASDLTHPAVAMTDSTVGRFEAEYDADGQFVREEWPNGVLVTAQVNEAGTTVGLTYDKPGCGSANCVLYADSVLPSAHGQWRERQSTISGQRLAYDDAGRLLSVRDTVGSQCETRTYAYDGSTNRTGVSAYAPAAGGACQETVVSASREWEFDTADRASGGYSHDTLGRAVTVPSVDSPTVAEGNISLSYYSSDLVRSISNASGQTEYTVDVMGDRVRSWTTTGSGGSGSGTHHYACDGDSPVWTAEGAGRWTRTVTGLAGTAGIWDSVSGGTWKLANLHGDFVATIPEGQSTPSATHEATEFGMTRSGTTADQRYGYLGAYQRATDPTAGLTLMGVRLYNPVSGRFLQVDPLVGGSANPYEYAGGDPFINLDTDGRAWKCEIQCNLEGMGGKYPWCNGKRVYGCGEGKTQSEAVENGKHDAASKTPKGCYPRHCKATKCSKNKFMQWIRGISRGAIYSKNGAAWQMKLNYYSGGVVIAARSWRVRPAVWTRIWVANRRPRSWKKTGCRRRG